MLRNTFSFGETDAWIARRRDFHSQLFFKSGTMPWRPKRRERICDMHASSEHGRSSAILLAKNTFASSSHLATGLDWGGGGGGIPVGSALSSTSKHRRSRFCVVIQSDTPWLCWQHRQLALECSGCYCQHRTCHPLCELHAGAEIPRASAVVFLERHIFEPQAIEHSMSTQPTSNLSSGDPLLAILT